MPRVCGRPNVTRLAGEHETLKEVLNEGPWRMWAAADAIAWGYGGIGAVVGRDRHGQTYGLGGDAGDKDGAHAGSPDRMRRSGAGRPRHEVDNPGCLVERNLLSDLTTRGTRNLLGPIKGSGPLQRAAEHERFSPFRDGDRIPNGEASATFRRRWGHRGKPANNTRLPSIMPTSILSAKWLRRKPRDPFCSPVLRTGPDRGPVRLLEHAGCALRPCGVCEHPRSSARPRMV